MSKTISQKITKEGIYKIKFIEGCDKYRICRINKSLDQTAKRQLMIKNFDNEEKAREFLEKIEDNN